MSLARLSSILALSSLLGAPGAMAFQQTRGDVETQDVTKEIYPQRTEGFPTYWWVRTNWKVYNPQSEAVQVNVRCARYGYNSWYWLAPYQTVSGSWGCEGAELFVYNDASENSGLWVQATTW